MNIVGLTVWAVDLPHRDRRGLTTLQATAAVHLAEPDLAALGGPVATYRA